MNYPRAIPFDGPDRRRYVIVPLDPAVVRNVPAGVAQLGFRRLTVRVFDAAEAMLFDVRTIVALQQVPQAQLRLVAEAKWRIQSKAWTDGETYEL